MSKLGLASRTQAARLVLGGSVRVNGVLVRDPDFPVLQGIDRIDVDGHAAAPAARRVIMLNKPRGLLTTTRDEKSRATVYRCFDGAALPWLAPVGRLDKASEGLLLFSNDPVWAAGVTDPKSGLDKTYHVQIDRQPSTTLLHSLATGVDSDGERLATKSVRYLRAGERNAWLEIVLDEGKNRHIRRLLAAHEVSVLRLVRVAVGTLPLGDLPKGRWRDVTDLEIAALVTD
jgi:23S rRNA pseudouridine2605 synthase